MICNQSKGTHCPCGKRWAFCKDCSPSQAIAHGNRVKNRYHMIKPLDSGEYRMIDNIWRSVLHR